MKKKQTTHIIKNSSCDMCHTECRTLWGFKPAKDEMTIAICKKCLIKGLRDLNGRDTT